MNQLLIYLSCSLRTELTEAKTRMEGYKSPSPAHSREVMSSAPGSPAGQENMVRAGSGRSSSLVRFTLSETTRHVLLWSYKSRIDLVCSVVFDNQVKLQCTTS